MAGDLNVLTTRPGARQGVDLIVDGRALAEIVGDRVGDTCSPLGGVDPSWRAAVVARLSLDAPLLLLGEREPLLVCTECGHVECGAVIARITASDGIVTWSDFGWGGHPVVDDEPWDDLGPFRFEWHAYRTALTGLA